MSTTSQERMKSTVGDSKLVVQSSLNEDGLIVHPLPGKRKSGIMKKTHMTESPHIVDYVYVQPDRTPASTVFTATSTQVYALVQVIKLNTRVCMSRLQKLVAVHRLP